MDNWNSEIWQQEPLEKKMKRSEKKGVRILFTAIFVGFVLCGISVALSFFFWKVQEPFWTTMLLSAWYLFNLLWLEIGFLPILIVWSQDNRLKKIMSIVIAVVFVLILILVFVPMTELLHMILNELKFSPHT